MSIVATTHCVESARRARGLEKRGPTVFVVREPHAEAPGGKPPKSAPSVIARYTNDPMQLRANGERNGEERDRIPRDWRENVLDRGGRNDERVGPVLGAVLQCVQKFVKHSEQHIGL